MGDAFAVKVHQHHSVTPTCGRNGGEQARAGLRHDDLAVLHVSLHGLVTEEGDDQRHRSRAQPDGCAGEIVEGQGVGVGNRSTENHNVTVDTLGENSEVTFAIRELSDLDLAGLAVVVAAQVFLEVGIASDRENEGRGWHRLHLNPKWI